MARTFFLATFMCVLGAYAGAQQLSQSSLYWLDPVQFNPAYAGLDNSLSVTANYRAQWTGLDGAPTQQRLSAHLPVYFLSSGVGVEVERDVLGARQLNRFGLSYNYQLVRPTAVWSLGVSARMTQLSLDGSLLRTAEGSYDQNVIVHNDDLLPTSSVDNGSLAFGAGLYYQSENLEGGLSVQNANAPTIDLEGASYDLQQQYHFYLRARFDLFGDFEALPMVGAYSDGTQHQANAGVMLRYDENVMAGVAYRGYNDLTSDAIIIMAGVNLSDQFRLAYAYDLTVSDLKTVNDGSHEVTLKYNLGQRIGAGVPPPIIYNPRAKE